MQKVKAGDVINFDGPFAGKAFRVINGGPYEDMLMGYIFTQNTRDSQHALKEVIDTNSCSGMDFIRTSDDTENDEDGTMMLDLPVGSQELIFCVHLSPVCKFNMKSRLIMPKISADEVLAATASRGQTHQIPDSNCTIKLLTTPYNHGALIVNAAGPGAETIEVNLRFVKENFRVCGEADDVCEIIKEVQPGKQEFVMLEKIHENEPGNVKTSFAYAMVEVVDTEAKVVAKMLEMNQPDKIVFKGKPTEVYSYKMTLKDSIYFMWENRCKFGPHADSEPTKPEPAALKRQATHNHRERA